LDTVQGVASPIVATVRIEGVAFSLDEAAELARRTRQHVGADPEARFRDRLTGGVGTSPAFTSGTALAVQVEQRVHEGGGDLLGLTAREREAASAVLDEWLQSREAPDAVRTLYRVLGSD
jgi:hypothetical protein